MTGKFKTMTLVEEAELDRLRQRQIKDYNPALNSLTKIQDQIFKIFDDKELTDEGKCKILAQLQEHFGFLLNKFKNAGLPPPNILHTQPAMPLPAPDDHAGDGPPAGVVEADAEGYFSPRESVHEEEGNASTETLSPATSLKDLTTSSNASFLTVQPQPDFSLPSQEEANISSQFTKKFAELSKFLNENKKHISTNAKKELVLNGKPIPDSHFPDLLRSLYKRNQSMNFTGLAEFESMLRQLNASSSLVSLKDAVTALSKPKSTAGSSQYMSGKGLSHKHKSLSFSSCPPGKKPRFLHVFRM